jgi:alcohol dehydrogenase, propanol-preferring
MKAMLLERPAPVGDGPLTLVDLPDPEPGPGEIAVAVSACGVCRTDLHLVEGELVPPSYPVVPGHQAVGRVIGVASDVSGLSPGDRVGVAWVGRVDGVCRFCREGRENLCLDPTFTGFHRNGGFAERVIVAAPFAHPIPDSFTDDAAAAPLLCAGIIGYRALKQSGLAPGRSVAFYGFGAAAHIAIQVARAWGCEVFVVSRGEDSLLRARGLGAAWTGLPGTRLPRPVQHAVSFAPVGSVIPDALRDLDRGGTLSLAGIYLDRVPQLDYEEHLFNERAIVSTTANTREDARELLEIAADHRFRTDVAEFPLDGANEALRRLKEGTLGAQAGVLRIGSGVAASAGAGGRPGS